MRSACYITEKASQTFDRIRRWRVTPAQNPSLQLIYLLLAPTRINFRRRPFLFVARLTPTPPPLPWPRRRIRPRRRRPSQPSPEAGSSKRRSGARVSKRRRSTTLCSSTRPPMTSCSPMCPSTSRSPHPSSPSVSGQEQVYNLFLTQATSVRHCSSYES
ncbi:hypothetical protein ZEAMMB73_Zm00001d039990 [Zea mays]|uniref:Uncharacterized protein n=1 Tax=Zea mays TaxID=4577 RepID=A0A1D6MM27_MAIZE|nr:hypothetical protein ZEAMMB73_Zm00001d039990 [Zea mays]